MQNCIKWKKIHDQKLDHFINDRISLIIILQFFCFSCNNGVKLEKVTFCPSNNKQ